MCVRFHPLLLVLVQVLFGFLQLVRSSISSLGVKNPDVLCCMFLGYFGSFRVFGFSGQTL